MVALLLITRPVTRISQKGGEKPQGGQKPQGGIFLTTILDVCSNRVTKREMRGTYFKWGAGHHWPPAGEGPANHPSN